MDMQCAGVKVHYTIKGQGSRRVVLLHGWGCAIPLMGRIAQLLEKDMTVLSLDFPGHGDSGFPPEPWGVPEYARCLKELLERLNFLPCDVIAHSFGGRVTIELASEDPTMFDRIIMTGAAGIRPPASEKSSRRTQLYKRLRRICDGMEKMRIFGRLPDVLREALIRKFGSKDYAALDPEMRKTFVKVVNYDQTEKLSSIQSSTLLVWGTQDTETPLWMGQKMEKEIPDSALVLLEGGTHFAYLEQSDRFGAIARSFLVENR